MKVSDKTSGVGSAPSVTGSKPSSGVQSTSVPAPATVQADAVSVSSSAQFLAVAGAELARIPDIRTDKVQAIKAQMDADSYHPDGDAVADSLVREYSTPAPTEGMS